MLDIFRDFVVELTGLVRDLRRAVQSAPLAGGPLAPGGPAAKEETSTARQRRPARERSAVEEPRPEDWVEVPGDPAARTWPGQVGGVRLPVLKEAADQWRPVPWKPAYEVTQDGRVRGPRGLLTPRMQGGKAMAGTLTRALAPVILEVWGSPAPCYAAAWEHIDGNPMNCAYDNLRWTKRGGPGRRKQRPAPPSQKPPAPPVQDALAAPPKPRAQTVPAIDPFGAKRLPAALRSDAVADTPADRRRRKPGRWPSSVEAADERKRLAKPTAKRRPDDLKPRHRVRRST